MMNLLTEKEIFNVVCTNKVGEKEIQSDEEDKEESINVTTKEAFGAFKIVSQYIEQSTEYNDQKLKYFKKITLNPDADYFYKNKAFFN